MGRMCEIKGWKCYLLNLFCLFPTPWTVACQAPLSMEFSRQEYWSGLPFPSPGDLPNPGIEPGSPTLQADSWPSEPWGWNNGLFSNYWLGQLIMEMLSLVLENWFWDALEASWVDKWTTCLGLKIRQGQSGLEVRFTEATDICRIT